VLLALIRGALLALLAAIPRRLHASLDAWARAEAQRRAERRRQRLLQRRQAAR